MKTPLMSSKSGGKAPHCKVCGDESSGFHYGVDSCEGCKGFFRRCITQGMNHKCANEEKCEITPFTRNSCQYCRLKKCFEVGMSREASRLGRRPKRLKEVGGGGEGSGGGGGAARSHTSNLPIAPYPSANEVYKLRMAELQKILQNNGAFKAEHMQAFLTAAKASFQEHSKSGAGTSTSGGSNTDGQNAKGGISMTGGGELGQMMDISGLANLGQSLASPTMSGNNTLPTSTMSEAPTTSTDNSSGGLGCGGVNPSASIGAGMVGGLSGVDSPSSMHSPGGSVIDFSSLAALDSFLFDQSLPATPSGGGGSQQSPLDGVAELQALNSPFDLNNVNLDPVPSADTSPLPADLMMGIVGPLGMGGVAAASSTPSSSSSSALTNGGVGGVHSGSIGAGELSPYGLPAGSTAGLLNMNSTVNSTNSPGVSGVSVPQPSSTSSSEQLQFQQYQQQQNPNTTPAVSLSVPGCSGVVIKTEAGASYPSTSFSSCAASAIPSSSSSSSTQDVKKEVKKEPQSPTAATSSCSQTPKPRSFKNYKYTVVAKINLVDLLSEIKKPPSEERRLLMEEVTEAVVEAHFATTETLHHIILERSSTVKCLPMWKEDDVNTFDVDVAKKSADELWKKFVGNMIQQITNLIRFCKKLPGFVDIGQDDQVLLIKQGSFEVLLTRFALLVDHENQTLMDPTFTYRAHRNVIRFIPMANFFEEFFTVGREFCKFKLTDGEIALFTSILLICPWRKNLKDVVPIRKIQSLYQQALYYLMKHNHPDPDTLFCQLMELIPCFNRINNEHFKALNDIRVMDSSIHFPPLHQDIWQPHDGMLEDDDDDEEEDGDD